MQMKAVYGLHPDEGRIRPSFPLKLKTKLWWPSQCHDEYFETMGDQSTPLTTTWCNLAARVPSIQNEGRPWPSFVMKAVYGLHF